MQLGQLVFGPIVAHAFAHCVRKSAILHVKGNASWKLQVQNTHWAYYCNSLVIKLWDKSEIFIWQTTVSHVFKSDLTPIHIQTFLTPWVNKRQIQRSNSTDGERKNRLSNKRSENSLRHQWITSMPQQLNFITKKANVINIISIV